MSGQRTAGPRLAVFAALILASITSTLLVAARVIHTRRLGYVFLVYNLVLAWIPLGMSVAVHALDGLKGRAARIATAVTLAAWLAFFPNAPYLMTDLLHLKVQGNRLLWLDLIALQAFAWTGLALGFVSLDIVQSVIARRAGRVASWLFAGAVMGLSAFGIYLGRFQRWNSWDVVRDPLGLFSDIAHMVLHPFAHAHVVAFSAVLAAFLLTAYLVVQSLTWHPSRNG
jgi:uncharacterized membrane protein